MIEYNSLTRISDLNIEDDMTSSIEGYVPVIKSQYVYSGSTEQYEYLSFRYFNNEPCFSYTTDITMALIFEDQYDFRCIMREVIEILETAYIDLKVKDIYLRKFSLSPAEVM